jgi:hypothetical protein
MRRTHEARVASGTHYRCSVVSRLGWAALSSVTSQHRLPVALARLKLPFGPILPSQLVVLRIARLSQEEPLGVGRQIRQRAGAELEGESRHPPIRPSRRLLLVRRQPAQPFVEQRPWEFPSRVWRSRAGQGTSSR